MKLLLQIESTSKSTVCRPGDKVRGTLVVQGCLKNVVQVKATLQGREKTRVSAEANGTCPNQSRFTIFKRSKLLDAKLPAQSDSGCSNYTHFYPFEFEAPKNLCCSCKNACQLPPSLQVDNHKLRVGVTYSIVASVQRRAFGGIKKTATVRQEVFFTSNPTVTSLPSSCISSLPADRLNEDSGIEFGHSNQRFRDDYLPQYSPALQMELALPQPPVLVRGRGTPVRLVLRTPPEMFKGGELYIRDVSMQLKSSVSASVRNTWHNITQVRSGCTINGAVPIDAGEFELQLGDWGTFVVVGSDCKPTFTSCMLNLAYSLEVVAGISKGLNGPIQTMNCALEVLVMDPPPEYEEPDRV